MLAITGTIKLLVTEEEILRLNELGINLRPRVSSLKECAICTENFPPSAFISTQGEKINVLAPDSEQQLSFHILYESRFENPIMTTNCPFQCQIPTIFVIIYNIPCSSHELL